MWRYEIDVILQRMMYWFVLLLVVARAIAKKHQMIIKYADVPTCRNCLFYRAPPATSSTAAMGLCTKFGSQHIVTGRIDFLDAVQARTQEGYCGLHGRDFVPLPRSRAPVSRWFALQKRRWHMEWRLWRRWFMRILWFGLHDGCECVCDEEGCQVVGCDDCEVVPLLRFLTRK